MAVILAAVPTLVWWLERLIALRSSGWFAGETTFAIGGDFRSYHTAATLVVEGRGSLVYNAEVFQAAAEGAVPGPLGYPPLVALVTPLGWLSFEAAWFAWSAASVVFLCVALSGLGARRWPLVAASCLLFPPIYFALTWGQLSALWLLLVAGVYVLLKSGKVVLAGGVAGLLILKPTLALGIAIWWLVKWSTYRRAALAAVASAMVTLLASYVAFPEIWSGFGSAAGAFLGLRNNAATQWAQFSVWGLWDLLLPTSRALATALGVVSSLGVVLVAAWMIGRARGLERELSVAVLATVLAAPHLLAYDWTLLIVPGVLLWTGVRRSALAAAAVAGASAWSILLTNAMLPAWGWAVQLAPIALMAVIWSERNTVLGIDMLSARSS